MFQKGNQFAKGNPPNKTSFKKGHPAPKTAFKKGHIPYNKGTARKIFKSVQGYIFVYKPNHPFCNKQYYIKRARLVMEKMLGRYLKPQEVVHHINGIKNDDRPKNLQLFKNNSEHRHFDNRWTHHHSISDKKPVKLQKFQKSL